MIPASPNRHLIPLDRELRERLAWLVRLRWLAAAGVVLGGWAATSFVPAGLSPAPFFAVGLALALYNLLVLLGRRYFEPEAVAPGQYGRFVCYQITLDWVALICLIHYAGGVRSPISLAFIFHLTFSAVLLSRRACYVLAGVASLLVGGLAYLEGSGIWPPAFVGVLDGGLPYGPLSAFHPWLFLTGLFAATAFLVTSITTHLREKEERLLRSERALHEENLRRVRLSALGEGIAGAAHCIKNVLGGIEGGGYMIDVGLGRQRPDKVARGREILHRNSGVLKDLVLDMLTYARSRDPAIEPSDVNELCTSVAESMREEGRGRGVEIGLRLQPDIGPVLLDPKGIHRCVLNLVANAIDACAKEGGRVEVSTRLDEVGGSLEIAVADNGCGISEEHRQGLFKVFFSTKGSRGTGLGLAVTQKIVEEHGGRIAVQSEPDAGTRFTVTLPLRPPGET